MLAIASSGRRGGVALLVCACLHVFATASSQAKEVSFSKKLSADEARCLSELIQDGKWKDTPQSHTEMMSIAEVGRADFNGDGQKAYVFVFNDGIRWCGTAGCQLLIGETRSDGVCHLLYSGSGDTSFTVLRRKDNGYRRLYMPCEARFDGRQYQRLHADCPNAVVRR
jgi:hypothetical protein